jgi:ATP-dependent RNA helicase RhlE
MSLSRIEAGFAGFALHPDLHRGIAAAGFTEPRPIQTATLGAALEGRDILGLAQTGTGKTAAFALPLLERVRGRRAEGPLALVVAPTRELATQISEEVRLLARFTDVRVATVFGGVSAAPQIAALRQRPEIVVACPGRLLDLQQQRAIRLDRVEVLVLDEADHMFDMGFLPDIRRILAALPVRRQNLLFSATMPSEIRGLADGLLRDPHVVDLNRSRPVDTVEHTLFPVDGTLKFELLQRVLAEEGFVSAIVFTRTKHRARKLARQLDGAGYRAVALQGNMSQNQRERAMEGFRARRFHVLVATDIAARGIDVEQVSHVVNFDMPTTVEGYTHRIGRTGRAERRGRAYTFVTPEDHDLVRAVERRMGAAIPRGALHGPEGAPHRSEARPAPAPVARTMPVARPAASSARRRRMGARGGSRPPSRPAATGRSAAR